MSPRVVFLILAGVANASPIAQEPGAPPSQLLVYPAAIRLDDGGDLQRVTALGLTPSGATVDHTGSVQWRMLEPDLAEVSRGDVVLLRGLREGDGTWAPWGPNRPSASATA
jgi:hypothetical protein